MIVVQILSVVQILRGYAVLIIFHSLDAPKLTRMISEQSKHMYSSVFSQICSKIRFLYLHLKDNPETVKRFWILGMIVLFSCSFEFRP